MDEKKCPSQMPAYRKRYRKLYRKKHLVELQAYHKNYNQKYDFQKWRAKKLKEDPDYYKRLEQRYRKKKVVCKKAREVISLSGKKCNRCGSAKNLQRHHSDYRKPFKVEILCSKCHHVEHSQARLKA